MAEIERRKNGKTRTQQSVNYENNWKKEYQLKQYMYVGMVYITFTSVVCHDSSTDLLARMSPNLILYLLWRD
jgi:hypothetical protein